MQLKIRFFLIFSILTVTPLLLFSYIAYTHYMNLSNTQISSVSSNIMKQAVEKNDSVFSSIQNILEQVQYTSPNENTLIQNLQIFSSSHSAYTDLDIYETNMKMKSDLQGLISSMNNINGIFIFTPSGVILGQGYGNGVEIRSNYDPYKDDWYQKTLQMKGKIYMDGVKSREFLINDTPSVSFSMCIYDVYTRAFLGILYINCSPDILSLDSVDVMPEGTCFSIKRGEEILYQNESSLLQTIPENTIIYTSPLSFEDVTLTAYFDKTRLAYDFQETLFLMVGVLLFFFILFIILAYFLARYLTQPITTLSKLMKHPNEETVSKSPYLNRTDEIGTLYNQYQTMLEENNRYIKSEYENKLILMDSQMKALEAQINAHFLYNTLEAINSLAEIEGSPDISTMALALGDMFRYSIKTKSALVTLKEELAHVQNFITIQLIRFDHAFKFSIDVPDELLSHQILKLTLQPLVENALYHGLLHCNAGSSICLCAQRHSNGLLLSITDDGVGISENDLNSLLASLEKKSYFRELNHKSSKHIGLKNINDRIHLYYGENYGLHIVSQPGKGTTVTLNIPDIPTEK